MLIVCTTDRTIVRTAQDARSGAPAWGQLVVVDPELSQEGATDVIEAALGALGAADPLCFSAHGNNEEIGDEDDHWTWTYRQIGELLARQAPRYAGKILIHACASQIVNFSSNLAVTLERQGVLAGTWIYGYNRALPADAPFPRPDQLDRQVDLQGTRVS
ncbi:hypothetical protein [Longimicrobium sp.]|uniref:hypothetical protein n=1 Tax=Longimicrobium sp. TaxID=2029185 RepID=UPI003B3BD580